MRLAWGTKVSPLFRERVLSAVLWWASIFGLLFRCCPSPIIRAVRSIIVNPVYAFPGRLLSRIGVEVLKRAPAFANCYPASAVSVKRFVVWVVASTQHCRPSKIRSAAKHSVLKVCSLRDFAAQAPTRTTEAQSWSGFLLYRPAIALALPPRCMTIRRYGAAKNKPAPETLAGQIVRVFSHSIAIIPTPTRGRK